MRRFDAVVIGSGFGGSVVACRLAERGRSVLVLERGRRWGRTDFPRPGRKDAPWWFDRGRTGIYEVVTIDNEMRTMIHDGAGEHELERNARQRGPSIREDGIRRVLAGSTTLEEVLRVTRGD